MTLHNTLAVSTSVWLNSRTGMVQYRSVRSVLTVSPNCCSRGCIDQQQAAEAHDTIVFNNHMLLLRGCCCSNHAAATVTQHDMKNYVMRCLGMVTKSDQTVVGNFHLYTTDLGIQVLGISTIAHQTIVGNFHLYTTDLGIQVLGISNIAHPRKFNIKPHSHCASA